MNREFTLPALVGNSSLGFLAALGVQALCCDLLGDQETQVGWPQGPSLGAVLRTSAVESVEDLAQKLAEAASTLTSGSYLPLLHAMPPEFFGGAAGTDPLREFTVSTGRELAFAALAEPASERWITALLALDEPITEEKRRGSLPVTPFAARGPGTVMFYRTLRDLAKVAADPTEMLSALIFWIRRDSIGGYLDHKAIRDASFQASRKDADNYGVPSAGWLAMMSLAHFPSVTARRDVAVSPCWPRIPYRRPLFRWPVWQQMLGSNEISVLLSHPAVAELDLKQVKRSHALFAALAVSAVYESERMEAGNNDGPLGKPVRLWPKPSRPNER